MGGVERIYGGDESGHVRVERVPVGVALERPLHSGQVTGFCQEFQSHCCLSLPFRPEKGIQTWRLN